MSRIMRDRLRLAATYLALIMLMSAGFSIVFYTTSTRELGRRPDMMRRHNDMPDHVSYMRYLGEREREVRAVMAIDLVMLNMLALVIGAGISYVLAYKMLQPIEQNAAKQLQFVNDASHELRTPLTALRTANEVALRDKTLTLAAARTIIKANIDDTVRLQTLADSMLGLLRKDDRATLAAQVSLRAVVKESIELVMPQASKQRVTFDVDVSDTLTTRGSQQRLVQLFTILLDNAVKYSRKGAKVSVIAHAQGKLLVCEVRDTGIGMDEATAAQVFDRFYRGESARSTPGNGLGLAIAQAIVQAHQGAITVISAPGQGSTFCVSLPLLSA